MHSMAHAQKDKRAKLDRAFSFEKRAFLRRADIPALEMRLWMRAFRTPLNKKADYLPKYAVG